MQLFDLHMLVSVLAISEVATALVLIPEPSGPFGVALTTLKMVDENRIDPFAPTKQNRAIMVSIFHPALASQCKNITTQAYMPPVTAAFEDQQQSAYGIPAGSFENFQLQLCVPEKASSCYVPEFPIVLFSTALGTTRHYYNALAQSVASTGFIVITIDHPYDADIVEFPDGSIVYGIDFIDSDDIAVILADPKVTLAVATRRDDAIFALNELRNGILKPSVRWPATQQAGMFGHSLGGATTSAVMIADLRVAGGINLDGAFLGPGYIQKDLREPFLLFGHSEEPAHNLTNDPTWAYVWSHLTGFKKELSLKSSRHYTFTDLPLLVDLLGLRANLSAPLEELVGSIDGKRALQIISDYTSGFFDFVLKGEKTGLVNGPSSAYPEVSFLL